MLRHALNLDYFKKVTFMCGRCANRVRTVYKHDKMSLPLLPEGVSNALHNLMAKAKTKTPVDATGKPETKGNVTHQQNAHTAKRARLIQLGKLIVIMLVMAVIAACLECAGADGRLALLTIFPDGMQLSGRAGSVVHQRNGVRRNYVTPALVQNAATQEVRASFSINASGFRDLTQAQIDAWNAAAPNFTYQDRFGRTKPFPSGISLFNSLNRNLFTVGAASITSPPVPAGVPAISALVVTADSAPQLLSIAYTPTPTDADVAHAVFATAQLSPGVSRPRKSDFRIIGIIGSGAASPFLGTVLYDLVFGAQVAGAKVFVKVESINEITGQAGAEVVNSAIVA